MVTFSGTHTHSETGKVYSYAGSAFHVSHDEQQRRLLHCEFEFFEAGVSVLKQVKVLDNVDDAQAQGLADEWACALVEMTFPKLKALERCFTVEGTEIREMATPKGRGVFATRAFAKGELVETAYVILGGTHHGFDRYTFNYSAAMGKGSTKIHQAAIVLGNGSLYNGANPANMRFEADVKAKAMRFFATRAIEGGEELTVNYSSDDGGPISPNNRWFEKKGISML